MRLQQTHLDEWRHLLMELQHEQQQVKEEQQQLEQQEAVQQLLNSLSPQKDLVPRAHAVPNGWATDSRSPERRPPASAPETAVSNSGSLASLGVPPTISQSVKGSVLSASSPAPATRAATRKDFSAAASRVQMDLEVAMQGMGCDMEPSFVEPTHEERAEEAETTRMSIASVKTTKSFDPDKLHFESSPSPSPRSPQLQADRDGEVGSDGAHMDADADIGTCTQLPGAGWEVRVEEKLMD